MRAEPEPYITILWTEATRGIPRKPSPDSRASGSRHSYQGLCQGSKNLRVGSIDGHCLGPLDASLSGLTIGSLTLTPTFDSDVTEYSAETSNNTNTITAVATEEDATITIKVGETKVDNGDPATWADGANTVTITVS